MFTPCGINEKIHAIIEKKAKINGGIFVLGYNIDFKCADDSKINEHPKITKTVLRKK